MTSTATTEDGRYSIVQLDRPFVTALVCRRCGALVQRSIGTGDGTAQAVHDDYHARLNAMLTRLNDLA